MAGKDKYATNMTSALGEPIEAACPIMRPGGAAGQIAGGVGGVAGAVIAGRGSKGAQSDVQIGQTAWLGVGPAGFAITKASMMGKPKGDPLVRAAYNDVTGASVTEGKITVRMDLDLSDGRHIAFEAKRLAAGKASVEVIELLRSRCPSA
ncbi:MAG: hypothetical protein M3527_03760 [Actinomycetota bacterium]|nr:hypothetical protein [Acidimicrobiia bacterium]MDQ3293552.1 hypothetical protein [Actinomycetota bacterium]